MKTEYLDDRFLINISKNKSHKSLYIHVPENRSYSLDLMCAVTSAIDFKSLSGEEVLTQSSFVKLKLSKSSSGTEHVFSRSYHGDKQD